MKASILIATMMTLAVSAVATAGSNTKWSDQYGDVMVLSCNDGTYVYVEDPNRCGEAMAKGALGCTEMPVLMKRSKAVKVDSNVIELSMHSRMSVLLEVQGNGQALLLKPDFRSSNSVKAVQMKATNVSESEFNYFCDMPVEK